MQKYNKNTSLKFIFAHKSPFFLPKITKNPIGAVFACQKFLKSNKNSLLCTAK